MNLIQSKNFYKNSPKLSNMLNHYKMQSKPVIDFGKSPEKNEMKLRETVFESNKRSVSPQYQYIRIKNKYKQLKESKQFPPKNCFNRN